MDMKKIEKRRAPRAHVRFVVAYDSLSPDEPVAARDVSQTKNMSTGGMLLTTSRAYSANTRFNLKVRLPSRAEPVMIGGQVLESHQATSQVYDTRVQFVQLQQEDRQILSDTVNYFLRKESIKN